MTEISLPPEVLTIVISFVDAAKDLLALGCVSKEWHEVSSDQDVRCSCPSFTS